MFPLLIFVRQQHGNAYLHYRPAPRGAFPKPFTQRLISSYSLLSLSSSNWEHIEGKREHYPSVSFRFPTNPYYFYSHAIGPGWPHFPVYSPFSSFTVLALNHTKKKKKKRKHFQLFISPYKGLAVNFRACKKMRFFCACLYCGKQKRDNAVNTDSFILETQCFTFDVK